MNHLIHETSPYLLQHAHNPVEWYPWGETALQRAKQENKPILVSIGYAACHWCHVMERESFEDAAVADFMNAHFINIKIDREERPDLDHIYMDAVQAMTGSGGWPLNVFLTPDKKPFYGGTYFPPVRAHNRASWSEVLEGVRQAFSAKTEAIEEQAHKLTEHLLQSNAFGMDRTISATDALYDAANEEEIAKNILGNADKVWGGFGQAPKFPQSQSICFLLRHFHFTKNEAALQQALLSLDKMLDGGIYDQLGGGFARYSTDNEWLVPHFEKMLYDNALLVSVMAEAYQLTGIEKYARGIRETLAFIEREMTSPEQGFYSALDADSEGEEGRFYTWDLTEIEAVLGENTPLFCEIYGVTAAGNWENKNIFWVKEPLEKTALQRGMEINDMLRLLESDRQKLLSEREKRVRPQLDDKILLGWNALMNTAYSKAYAALGNPQYLQRAETHIRFLESQLCDDQGNWYHTYKGGQARIPAFLDDYAYLIEAYLHLQEITGTGAYLLKARSLLQHAIAAFSEQGTGFFFYTPQGQEDVILRKKEVYDGATPSGNAVMARNLWYLSKVFVEEAWERRVEEMLQPLSRAIRQYPNSFAVWALCLQELIRGTNEIIITGQRSKHFIAPVMKKYIPNKIIQTGETEEGVFPLLKGKLLEGQDAVKFYLCKNRACSDPFTDVVDFLAKM